VLVITFGLCAAVAWGVADFLGGLATRQASLLAVGLMSQLVGATVAAAIVVSTGADVPSAHATGFALLAGVANAIGLAAFYRALAVGTMSIVAPIVGMSAILPVTVGIAGGERPTALHAVGIAVAVTGVVLASRERAEDRASRRVARLSIGLALLAAAGVGGNLAALDAAVAGAPKSQLWWVLLITRAVAVGLLVVAALAMHRPRRVPRRSVRIVLALGCLDVAANIFYATATHDGMVSLVAVLASLHPVVTVVLAAVIIHERLRASQRAGVALALVGATLIGVA
jgi:uncharacterized membrane protein